MEDENEEIGMEINEINNTNFHNINLKLKSFIEYIKKTPKTPSILLNFLILLFFFIFFAIISSNIVLWNNYNYRETYKQPSELTMTMEFQIELKPKDWKHRPKQMKIFLELFQNISGYPFLDSDLIEHYRTQSYFHPRHCDTDLELDFRLRNYYHGPLFVILFYFI